MSASIGNVAVYVSDLERAEAFYTDALGLEVLARIETPDVREVIVGNPDQGSQLLLAKRTAADEPVVPAGIWKIYVATDDVSSLYERAVSRGAASVAAPKHLERFRVTIGFVMDPDGYLVELGQRHEVSG